MSVTFIVPAYRSVSSLHRCLESIRKQKSFETAPLIVVVNGVDDGSMQLAKLFNAEVVFEPEANRALARNIGSYRSKTPWLAFIDADVVLKENWTQVLLKRVRNSHAGAIQGSIYPCSQSPSSLQRLREELWHERQGVHGTLLFKLGPISPCLNSSACLISRELFLSIRGFDQRLLRHQDVDLGLRLEMAGHPICFHPDAKAEVFFQGNMYSYLMRSINVGFHRPKLWRKWLPDLVTDPSFQLRNFLQSQKKRKVSFMAHLEDTLQWVGEIFGKIYSGQIPLTQTQPIFQRLVIGHDRSLLFTTEGKIMWLEQDAHRYIEIKYGLAMNEHDDRWYECCEEALMKKGFIP